MKVVDLSITRPVSVFIFSVAAVVFGLVALGQLPVDLLPEITYPSLTVRTELEGTAPAEVESLLTRPVENAVGVVNNVVRVVSSSRADTSEVTIELAWGTNVDMAALDVRERLDLVQLPTAASRPVLLRYDPQLDPIMRIGLYGSKDLGRLRFVADEQLRRALERIEGVAAAVVSGGLEEEMVVDLDERKLAALGLSIDQVRARLAAENVNMTGGTLREGQTEYLVRTVNELLRPEEIAAVVVLREGEAVVRLEDVATVRTGHKDREIITRIDGQESVELAVYKEGGTNTATVSDAVTERLDELRDELELSDPGLELVVVTDQARYIRQSLSSVMQSAVYGGLLAILVLFFFLRSAKKTLIIGISIPVSVVATFFLMYVAGVSLNIMSLGGLTLGIGLLVDNSIVVLEAIQRRRDEGLDETEAARAGTSEVGRAITASTLTTICVFVPVVFVEGVSAQLFRDQALTVAFSLVVSLAVALTLIPMLASRQLAWSAAREPEDLQARTALGRRGERLALATGSAVVAVVVGISRLVGRLCMRLLDPLLGLFDRFLEGFRQGYERSVRVVLRHPVLTLAATLAALAGSLALVPTLGAELFPELIQGELYAEVELPPGIRLEVTDRRLDQLAEFAGALDGVRMVYSIAGTCTEQGGVAGETRENMGQLTVLMQPPVSRQREDAVMAAIRQRIDKDNQRLRETSLESGSDAAAREITARFGRPSYFSFRNAVEVEIRGHNLNLLQHLAGEAVARMRGIPGLADVRSSTEGGHPELRIVLDRDRLASFGLSVADVADRVRSSVQGTIATDITRADRTIDVRLRAHESFRDSALDLGALKVGQVDGVPIQLGSVAEVRQVEGPADIRRAEGSRVAVITANLSGRDLGSAAEEITTALEGITWPEGYRDWRIGGQEDEMQTSFGSMKLAIGLAVFLVYLVMACQFESLLHPFVILFSVPFAVIGAVLTMVLFGVTINVVSLIGFVLLAGIVVNDAIVKIDCTNQLRRQGMAKNEALLEAGLLRLRPILMTTATTVLGLLPMALGLGEGAELRTPMALTVIGGMVSSTALTLLVVPAVYTLLDRGK